MVEECLELKGLMISAVAGMFGFASVLLDFLANISSRPWSALCALSATVIAASKTKSGRASLGSIVFSSWAQSVIDSSHLG